MDKNNSNYTKVTRDITILIGAYEVITGAIIFGLCYRYKPTQTFLQSQYGNQLMTTIKTRWSNQYNWTITKYESVLTSASKNKLFKKITDSIGLKTKRSTKAFAEGFVLGKVLIPVNIMVYTIIGKYVYNKYDEKYDETKPIHSNNVLYPIPTID